MVKWQAEGLSPRAQRSKNEGAEGPEIQNGKNPGQTIKKNGVEFFILGL